MKSVGGLSDVCSQIVLKCVYLPRIGRPGILWSVNKLARAITKWTRACDKRLARLITYIHFASGYKPYCHVGNTAWQCRLDCFKTLTLQEIFLIRNRLQVEHYASFEATRLFQWGGCARNRLVCHTFQRNLGKFLWMQVCAWTQFPRLISGVWWLLWCIQTQVKSRKSSKHEATRCMVKYPRTEWTYNVTRRFTRDILNCLMSILFPQTWILPVKEPCCTWKRCQKRRMQKAEITQECWIDSWRARGIENHKKNMDRTKQSVQKWTDWHKKSLLTSWRGPRIFDVHQFGVFNLTNQEVLLRWPLDLIIAQQSHWKITCTEIRKIIKNQSDHKIKTEYEKAINSETYRQRARVDKKNGWRFWTPSSSSASWWQSDH